eukprot:82010-Rhodomonas_salina.1
MPGRTCAYPHSDTVLTRAYFAARTHSDDVSKPSLPDSKPRLSLDTIPEVEEKPGKVWHPRYHATLALCHVRYSHKRSCCLRRHYGQAKKTRKKKVAEIESTVGVDPMSPVGTPLSAYMHAMRCPVLTRFRMGLRRD